MRDLEVFRIGQVAQSAGVKIETIRYYERAGLLPAPPRSSGRYRLYGPNDVRTLRFIRRARELGFPLDSVRALLRLAREEAGSCSTAQALATKHLEEVRTRIADLAAVEATLATTIQLCRSGRGTECALIAALARRS